MLERSILFGAIAVLACSTGSSELSSVPDNLGGTPEVQGPLGAEGSLTAPQGLSEPSSQLGIITAIHTAQQSATIRVTGLQWTSVPGTTINFTLTQNATIDLEANGSIYGIAGNYGNSSHCGFRFLVDNVAYGNDTWGDVIVGCGTSSTYDSGWWCPWTMRRTLQLRAGDHFATVQQTGWAGTTTGCESRVEDYSATRFRIVVR